MPKTYYQVNLTDEEIAQLKTITHKGSKHSARTIMHAHILLKTNDSLQQQKKRDREIQDFKSPVK